MFKLFVLYSSILIMGRLTFDQRMDALARLRNGESFSAIARLFGCAPSTISRLANRFQTTGRLQDRPRPGQPRCTTQRQDRNIVNRHLRNR